MSARASSARAALALACALSACAPREPDAAPPASPAAPPRAAPSTTSAALPPPAARGALVPSRPELRVAISAPSSVPYEPGSAGAVGQHVRVRVTNAADAWADVADARVAFTATRAGVAFPCAHHDGGSVKDPEPAALPPGGSFTYERDIDCALTALGRYDVGVELAFGREPGAADPAGAFALDVTATGPGAPRTYPRVPALQVALTANTHVRALTAAQWRRGDYRVALVLVNTGPTPLRVGELTTQLDVAATTTHIAPCPPDQLRARVRVDDALAPGRARLVPVALTCPLRADDDYDVTALVALGDAPPAFELGRVQLRVRTDERPPIPVDRPPGTIQIGEGP